MVIPLSIVGEPRIRSAIPGRIRWDVAALRDRPDLARGLAAILAGQEGIQSAEANPRTGRLLVHHGESWTPSALTDLVADALSNGAAHAVPEHGHDHDHENTSCAPSSGCSHDHDHDSDEQLESYVRNLTIGGVVLAGIGIKRLLLGPSVLAGSPVLFAVSALATIVSGYPFIRGALRSASGESGINTDTLVGSATIASILMRENVTALTVIWLLNLGEYLQAITLRRTRRAIRQLLEVEDEEIWLVVGESGQTEIRRPLAEVVPGNTLAVYAGERIPVDGKISAGAGTINESPITGESMPVLKNPGDQVFAGTVLLTGDLKIAVEKVGDETAVGRLIQRVEKAQALKAPIQTIGERFSAKFVPASFILAGVVFVVTGDFSRALTMLLVACPCAAGLATPTAVSAAIGNAAGRGILIKGGTHLEAASRLDTMVFDKTGTLTVGLPGVERVVSLVSDVTAQEVLALAASGELHSQHPLALAVVRHATEQEIVIPPHEECEIIVGRGMKAIGPNNRVLVGNQLLLEQFGVTIPEEAAALYQKHAQAGETMMYIVHQDRLIGLIGVRDKIRPEAADALEGLRREGIGQLLMLTGDGEEAASSVASIVGLTAWRSRLLPEEKYETIERLKEQGHRVAMAGDGINDAPALARADVGIAMGTAGSDVAIEAADIALAADDLRQITTTVRLSRQTIQIIRENYAMALGVNSIGVAIGAFGVINPFIAAALHNLSTLLVVINSARLITYNPSPRKRPNPAETSPGG
ncbi:Copper-exporting P-type ATPase A [Planctomycetes bacterium Pan216]|uniref:P-type Zn(2+) transporter n=1 Tax=Kolteria novifilia TaxID=2527975 RepID=A0A518B1R2_9BACT|nr:Copper-exporting P-type ATPase A [Planctomycetes bacterium Pan216]